MITVLVALSDPAIPSISIPTLLAVTLAAWAVLALLAWVLTMRRRSPPGPATLTPGSEPPAIVDLLVNGLRPTRSAAALTLLDLACRGHVRLTDGPDGQLLCRVPGLEPAEPLALFEVLLRRYVAGLLAGGSGPASAMLPDRSGMGRGNMDARRWYAEFDSALTGEARRLGLARRRLPVAGRVLLWAAAAVPAAIFGWWLFTLSTTFSLLPEFAGAVSWVGLGALVPRGLRATAAGSAVTSRWLGVRAALLATAEVVELGPGDRPPDRMVAWAAALAAAPDVMARLQPAGRGLAWSKAGSGWHTVRVPGFPRRRAPDPPPRPMLVAIGGLVPLLVLGSVAVWLLAASPSPAAWLFLLALLASWTTAIIVAGVARERYARMASWRQTVAGQVVRRWADTTGDDNSYRLAVDVGPGDEARVWSVDQREYERFPPGTAVHVTTDRRGRLVEIRSRSGP
jgi:hypothetical protein